MESIEKEKEDSETMIMEHETFLQEGCCMESISCWMLYSSVKNPLPEKELLDQQSLMTSISSSSLIKPMNFGSSKSSTNWIPFELFFKEGMEDQSQTTS
jgi:hypothetical protein